MKIKSKNNINLSPGFFFKITIYPLAQINVITIKKINQLKIITFGLKFLTGFLYLNSVFSAELTIYSI